MGCQSEVFIGDNLTFSVTTHDPDTGILTDADAVPSYRVYEDETATAILTDVMAKLDDANTTGFYTEKIACTTANGFEAGKSYNIYIQATVDGDTGGITYSFRAKSPTFDVASALTLDFGTLIERSYEILNNKLIATLATGAVALRNIGDSTTIASGSVTGDATTETRDELTWT